VPTLAEAGVPGYEATLWLSVSGPPGMPAPIVQRCTRDQQGAARPGTAEQLPRSRRRGLVNGTEELGRFMRAEIAKWGKVVRDTGATVN
jgi:tripartite-type tricarboxylate transporter receptor subunit TctC